MCHWCLLFGAQADQLPSCDTTFCLPATYMEDNALMDKMIDWDTVGNLPAPLAEQFPARIVPLRTTGDGNCLLHAVSRAIFGVELYDDLLRKKLHEELRTHLAWYTKAAPQFGEDDWKRILDNAGKSGSYLEFMHIFALANVIRRPILIYANDADMDKFGQGESGVAATFVPSRVGQSQCKQRPVILAWQSKAKNHYVPLVQIAGRDAAHWPSLALAFPNSLAEGERYSEYIHTNVEAIDPPLIKRLEEERAEREKQQELQQLITRAFTSSQHRNLRPDHSAQKLTSLGDNALGQPDRSGEGKGKERKGKEVLRDRMDEEEEEEEEDMDEDQAEALKELTNYLKKYREEQEKEEIETRKKFLEMIEEAKKKREEELKRLIAKKPRQEKMAWRGKTYDLMCYADLGDGIPRIIAWNKEDDLPKTAQDFMDEHGFGNDKDRHAQLVRLLAKKTLIYVMEELARGEGDEDSKTGKPETQPAIAPSVVLPICRHIPKKRGAPVLYTQGQLDGISKKLQQFNSEISLDPSSRVYSANSSELELFARTLNTLRDPAAYAGTGFQEAEFQVLNKFLYWPAAKLFPVLDVLRLLILHPRAAEYYLAVHNSSDGGLLRSLLDRTQVSVHNPQANCMIALKFFANMFAHATLESVAQRNASMIINGLKPLASSKDQRIRLPTANVILNFSSVLGDEQSMSDGKRSALELIGHMLQGEEEAETLYPLLVALGTLIYGDRESTTYAAGMSLEGMIARHANSPNTKIAEAAQDVLVLLKW